jgi:hypothetical protein
MQWSARDMGSISQTRPLGVRGRHYHLSDTTIGGGFGYRDDIFPSRREALAAARERADWLGALTGCRVHPLAEAGRYLLTTGRPRDAGRIIELEECDDPECLEIAYGSVC